MEYLVTMTTHVPAGATDEDIQTIRARESAHSRELAAQGHLLRLWRPPLRPGEWRTLGLFAAADDDELEDVLASMPLRVWRSDEPVSLSPHPNDPVANGTHLVPPPNAGADAEFLTTFSIAVPEGTPPDRVRDIEAREARRAGELAEQGLLVRLWVLPAKQGVRRVLSLWRAGDAADMQAILRSLPMDEWMTEVTIPLTAHPSDPRSD